MGTICVSHVDVTLDDSPEFEVGQLCTLVCVQPLPSTFAQCFTRVLVVHFATTVATPSSVCEKVRSSL